MTKIILDHFGGPLGTGPYNGKQNEIFQKWKKDIKELANCENVYAKLGGVNMDVNGFAWHERAMPPSSRELADTTRHFYDATIDFFGSNRCMFESNFPVDKLSCAIKSSGILSNESPSPGPQRRKAPCFMTRSLRSIQLTFF